MRNAEDCVLELVAIRYMIIRELFKSMVSADRQKG